MIQTYLLEETTSTVLNGLYAAVLGGMRGGYVTPAGHRKRMDDHDRQGIVEQSTG